MDLPYHTPDLMLHYDLGPKSMKLGKVDDASRVAAGLRKLQAFKVGDQKCGQLITCWNPAYSSPSGTSTGSDIWG